MAGITSTTGALTALAALLPNGTTRYVALYTVLPGQDGSGGTEVSGSGYARATCSAWTQDVTLTARRKNNADITFSALTGNVSGVVGWGVKDASTGGNLLAFGPMRTSSGGAETTKNFLSGDQPQFPVGEIWVELQVV